MSERRVRVFQLADHGNVLSTRHRAQVVADHLRSLEASEPDALWELNLTDIEVATPSFFHELLPTVHAMKDRAIWSCLNEDVVAALDVAEAAIHRAADQPHAPQDPEDAP